MSFILFVLVIGLLLSVMRLGRRVSSLEKKLKEGIAPSPSLHSAVSDAEKTFGFEAEKGPDLDIGQVSVTDKPEKEFVPDRFFRWIREDWLLKLGALLLLIGFGWFATYAFANNWIGPMGRIALGIVAGALILVLGWWRVQKYRYQGSIFLVLGSTAIILTLFAARIVYGFFTPLSVLGMMFLSTAFVALASVKFKVQSLSHMSLILAAVAPLLVATAVKPSMLFAYLFVVVLGVVWVTAITSWRSLTTTALVIVALYSMPHLVAFTSADNGVLLLYAYAFAAVFFVTHTIGILKLPENQVRGDLVTAAGNGLLLLAWIVMEAPKEWQSMIIVGWMIVFITAGFVIYKSTGRMKPFLIYAGIGVAMLATATAVELSGAALTIAYTIESALVALITYVFLRDTKVAQRASLLLLGPIFLSLSSIYSSTWSSGVLHKDFFVLAIMSIVLFALGIFFWAQDKEAREKLSGVSSSLIVGGSIYVYVIVWQALHSMLKEGDSAVMISLMFYTIVGLAVYFYGRFSDRKGFRFYGGVMLGFVVGRLLLVDVWQMAIAGRVITFFVVGALLVSTAFIGRKKKEDTSSEKYT